MAPVPSEPTEPVAVSGRWIGLFVAVAFVLAWLVALPLWLGGGLADPLAGIVLLVMMYTPAAATGVVLLARRRVHGATGGAELLRELGVWPPRPLGRILGLTIAAVVAVPVIVIAGVLVSALLGLVTLDLREFSGFAALIEETGVDLAGVDVRTLVLAQLVSIPLGAVLNALFAFGEEVGWRGWLLPALRPRGVWPALIISGAIWGLWHTPVILLGYNFGRTDQLGVVAMVVGCVAWGILLGWTRLRSGSIWPAVLGHGALNAAAGAITLFMAAGATFEPLLAGPLGLVTVAVIAVVVVLLVLTGQFGREGELADPRSAPMVQLGPPPEPRRGRPDQGPASGSASGSGD